MAQKKYNGKYKWMGKVIHWELCKWLKFDHADKWYMRKREAMQENENNTFLWNLEI